MLSVCLLAFSLFDGAITTASENSYSPYVNDSYPKNVYWGDTHLHTNLSVDVIDGNNPYGNGLSPDDAYRFARGDTITAHNGTKLRRQHPLDFLVVADHAENIGLHTGLSNGDQILIQSEEGHQFYERYKAAMGDKQKLELLWGDVYKKYGLYGPVAGGNAFFGSVWNEITRNADRHDDPGEFTAFIGYEYTSHDFNLHRVVIFKDDASKAQSILPFSQIDSKNPEDLWTHLSRYEQETGGEVIAIPHNGNFSEGHMFSVKDSKGLLLSQEYALTRSRWEPLYEVTQIKGDSETHPFLSPDDEFADFETLTRFKSSEKKENLYKRQYEYARSALKLGLDQQAKLGINPFKFGMIGSSDSHTSLSSVDENNYIGKGVWVEPALHRVTMTAYGGNETRIEIPSWKLNAAGYAAVWAEENTREALFAAMKRKETYATTGPRITVRFFGGWDYDSNDALRPDLAKVGYSKGVPMGGDLTNPPKGISPHFLIRAVKDPDGANLDRVQLIKGWHDKQGELHEKIYNIALSDGRKENKKGNIPPIDSTVDVTDASYTNTIGAAELAVVWQDPDFNKDELAFYYVRVLEIPTPRWTAYDAKFFGVKDIPEEVPMVTQERAYTSPIWYSPPEKAGGV